MVLVTLKEGKEIFDSELLNLLRCCRHSDAISKLEGLNPKALVDHRGRTLLHHAVAFCNPVIVKHLLDRGCVVNMADDVGITPLILAMETKKSPDPRIIKVLLDANADILLQDEKKRNPLQMALAVNGFMGESFLPVFMAALKKQCSGNREMIIKVLVDVKCSVAHAVLMKDAKITEYMLKNGYSVRESYMGLTALHYAVKNIDLDNAKLLLEHGADVNARDGYSQRVPLDFYHCQPTSAVKLELLRVLLNYGANPVAADANGRTFASEIFRNGCVDCAKILLEFNIDLLTTIDYNGCTLLHLAALNKNSEVIELFQGKKFDVNARDRQGDTVLYYAAQTANGSVLKFLLRNGIELSIKEACGRSVLYKCIVICLGCQDQCDALKFGELLLLHTWNSEFVYDNLEILLETVSRSVNKGLIRSLLAYVAMRGPTGNALRVINSDESFKVLFERYVRKIEEMKGTVINHAISLFDFLIEDEERLALFARNPETSEKLKAIARKQGVSDLFIVKVLQRRVGKAIITASLRNESAAKISKIKGLNCNSHVIDKIVSLLDDVSLRNVCEI